MEAPIKMLFYPAWQSGLRIILIMIFMGCCCFWYSKPASGQKPVRGAVTINKIDIFDPGKGREITPIHKAAERLSHERGHRHRSLAQIQNLITYEFSAEGDSEEEVLRKVNVQALKSAAARLYFENFFLLGLDILEPYLASNGTNSIARSTILEKKILPGNRVWMEVRVSVNLDVLYPDLKEKRFISKPNLRPIIAVHLEELNDGVSDSGLGGRIRVESTMEDYLFRVFSNKMRQPGLDYNLAQNQDLFRAGRMEAQRHNIDILITGTLSIRPIEEKEILFDNYDFREASLNLKMYRVDTGQLITEVYDRYSAAGGSMEKATNDVMDSMVTRATEKLAIELTDTWGNTMLDQGDYRLMLSGMNRDQVKNIYSMLKTFSPGILIYEKAFYGDVTVVNLMLPDDSSADVETFLRRAREPQLNVRKVDKDRFELELI
jgi:hypothetical protein